MHIDMPMIALRYPWVIHFLQETATSYLSLLLNNVIMSSLHQNVNLFSQLSYDIFPKWPHTHPHLWFHSLLHISKFSYADK